MFTDWKLTEFEHIEEKFQVQREVEELGADGTEEIPCDFVRVLPPRVDPEVVYRLIGGEVRQGV